MDASLNCVCPSSKKSFVVTGANKGIGLAIAKGLLDAGCFVFVGSRDVERGEAAVAALCSECPGYTERVTTLQLDVTDAASIQAAVDAVKARCTQPLTGLVNNAGGAQSMNFTNHADTLYTLGLNLTGVESVTRAFLPLLSPTDGRIVMVGSGAAPTFVSKCSSERQAEFMDPAITLERIHAIAEEYTQVSASATGMEDPKAHFAAAGFGDGGTYGCSKALLTSYAMVVAREHPGMKINSCSPGFVETDLTIPFAVSFGKTPQELGMVSTEKGAICPLFLAVGEPKTPAGQAWYYGSDSQRSPLHKYRSPGDPPYDGVNTIESAKSMADIQAASDNKDVEAR
mmetsp:Transcript_30801/g.50938  ORF Transcript_30801/g.50938 Transcript_30801/m.50938 type:complete len:342 (-) Transcript_30801:177-1202(-)